MCWMIVVAVIMNMLMPKVAARTAEGARNSFGLLGSMQRISQNEEGHLDAVNRLNFGVQFSPEKGSFTPEVANYNLLMVMDLPRFMQFETEKTCMTDEEGHCVNEQVCQQVTGRLDDQMRYGEADSKNMTCRYLSQLMTQLRASRVAISTKLMNVMMTEVGSLQDVAGTARNKRDTDGIVMPDARRTVLDAATNMTRVLEWLRRAAGARTHGQLQTRVTNALAEALKVVPTLANHSRIPAHMTDTQTVLTGQMNVSLDEVDNKMTQLAETYADGCNPDHPSGNMEHSRYVCSHLNGLLARFTNATATLQKRYEGMMKEMADVMGNEQPRDKRSARRNNPLKELELMLESVSSSVEYGFWKCSASLGLASQNF